MTIHYLIGLVGKGAQRALSHENDLSLYCSFKILLKTKKIAWWLEVLLSRRGNRFKASLELHTKISSKN